MQPGLPVFVNNTPSGISEQILWLVKNSGLNFSVQETAFSLNIQLKKTFLNKWAVNDHGFNENAKYQNFPNNPSKEFIGELQAKDNQIDELVKSLEKQKSQTLEAQESLDALAANKLKAFNDEKKSIQTKHEKLCADHKILKGENVDLMKDLNARNVALKSCKKESNDTAHKNQKKVENLEAKLKELVQFKITKESEEKELRAKTKKLDKKFKTIQEKEAELKVARNRLDRPVLGKVGAKGLGVNPVDDPENNSVNDPENNSVDDPENSSLDDLAAAKDSILVETESCEMKDPVIEAENDVLTKDFLEELLETFNARFGT